MITFLAAAANHLGLVDAVEKVLHRELPIINCMKCLAFWLTIIYGLTICINHIVDNNEMVTTILVELFEDVLEMVAAAFLSAWAAIWLDLAMGIIDKLYLRIYDKVYSTTTSANTHA